MTETYRGVHWGKYSTKRTDFGGRGGPGPGEYDPQADLKMKPDHLNMRDDEKNKKFDAKLPRYHEWVVKEEEKKVRTKRNLVDHVFMLDQCKVKSVISSSMNSTPSECQPIYGAM